MKIFNKNVFRNFKILERIEAGISLLGAEIKSIRQGRVDLSESFVRIKNNEAWLFNTYIHPYKGSESLGIDPRRARKLLLHKSQIFSLKGKVSQKSLTIVPVMLYTKHNLAKLEVGLARAKKKFEKKEAKKRRDLEREVERELRNKYQ
jgi:SsrA-binding protein